MKGAVGIQPASVSDDWARLPGTQLFTCDPYLVDEDPKVAAAMHEDHPLQRFLTLKMTTTGLQGSRLAMAARTLFDIPARKVDDFCAG